jgi:hypothetical protein
VNLALGLWQLSELSIQGVPQNTVGTLSIAATDDSQIAFVFASESMSCRGTAKSLSLVSISPKINDPLSVRGPRLFSYSNVWNSCLLLAQAKGFTLRLIGQPDERGSISRCGWRAIKDDRTELTADNPIELAGLIAQYEHHRPQRDENYWWRIDGPDLVTELIEQWAPRYFCPQGKASNTDSKR